MINRVATCRCGQLRVACIDQPVRVSVCHCLNCQKRSGSSFAAQARWQDDKLTVTGQFREWSEKGDSGSCATFRFCPQCGATVVFSSDQMPGFTAVAIGAFADPGFPPPDYSVYEERKHSWVEIVGDNVEHLD